LLTEFRHFAAQFPELLEYLLVLRRRRTLRWKGIGRTGLGSVSSPLAGDDAPDMSGASSPASGLDYEFLFVVKVAVRP
jgi:hypothetical protein